MAVKWLMSGNCTKSTLTYLSMINKKELRSSGTVFLLESPDGQARYKLLPRVIKSALVLGQTNAECEHSLSINAKVVTSDRPFLSNETIVGTRVVKEAVRFYDPVSNKPEKIPITEELKKQVRSSHALYKEHQEREKEEERR